MRQSFLIKIDFLQCFQFSLSPCNVLLRNGSSRQSIHSHFNPIHFVWEEICDRYKSKRGAVLCCVLCRASLLFLPLSVTVQDCRNRVALPLLVRGAQYFQVCPDNHWESFHPFCSQGANDLQKLFTARFCLLNT